MTHFDQIKVVNIEVVSGCNLRCPSCSLTITRKKLRFMSSETLDKVLQPFLGMDVLIAPYLGGEPLLHPDFPSVVRQIRTAGFSRVRIHTNGTILDWQTAKDLVDAGLNEVVFSIDGHDAAEFERMRPPAKFDVVRENLAMFLRAADDKVKVGVQCMVPPGTPKESNVDIADLRSRLAFEIVDYPHSWVWEGQIEGTVAPNEAPHNPCFFLQYYMTFDWKGNVLPCCRCLNSEHVVGNVNRESVNDVWYRSLENMRQIQLRGESTEPCSRCDWNPNAGKIDRTNLRVIA